MYQLWCLDYLSMVQNSGQAHKLSVAGLIVTLGIIYGDIGTSPLYVFKSIINPLASKLMGFLSNFEAELNHLEICNLS